MAHSPESPKRYVCAECQTMHAGTVVEHTDGGHRYSAPDECGCCGASSFVAEKDWPHYHE